jgi:predicted outer membrane protein
MKTKIWMAAVALSLGLFITSCDDDDDNQNPQLNQTDINFVTDFTRSNLGQVSINELGRDSGTDAQIKAYSPILVQDYQAAQKQIDSIAARFGVNLPTAADSASTAFYNSLKTTTRGLVFDSSFIANQITTLDALLADLNKASSQATESSLKNYVNQQIPIVTRQKVAADSIMQHF